MGVMLGKTSDRYVVTCQTILEQSKLSEQIYGCRGNRQRPSQVAREYYLMR